MILYMTKFYDFLFKIGHGFTEMSSSLEYGHNLLQILNFD